jgi:hypothetical protein
LNKVAAARSESLDGPTSKFNPKAPTKKSKKPQIVEDDASGLGDEDDTKEREAALSSPVKGKDSRQLTAVRFTYPSHSESFLIVIILDSSQG